MFMASEVLDFGPDTDADRYTKAVDIRLDLATDDGRMGVQRRPRSRASQPRPQGPERLNADDGSAQAASAESNTRFHRLLSNQKSQSTDRKVEGIFILGFPDEHVQNSSRIQLEDVSFDGGYRNENFEPRSQWRINPPSNQRRKRPERPNEEPRPAQRYSREWLVNIGTGNNPQPSNVALMGKFDILRRFHKKIWALEPDTPNFHNYSRANDNVLLPGSVYRSQNVLLSRSVYPSQNASVWSQTMVTLYLLMSELQGRRRKIH
ncbi:hypothetical protein EMCG_05967 [[Emmonsia] crescens]|uniref:Uncharacterized protein n=1 Tax=[Emmonsia] crescens TaxID=73230 RepID=A0A0G2ICE2_9EURO|nr:hypothetical protein EMCG_05967 [Emmonsia crescens UAMH 3008]